MVTRLTLLCHGATAATREPRFPADEPLDAAGRAAVARWAAAGGPAAEAIGQARRRLAGPERRTRETAAAFGLAVAVDPALADADQGRWSGSTLAEVAAAEPAALAEWAAGGAPHGGEGAAALLARAAGFMAAQAGAGGRVAGVTHPAMLRAAVVATLDAPAASLWRVEAPPLTIARFDHDGRRWTLRGLWTPGPSVRAGGSGPLRR